MQLSYLIPVHNEERGLEATVARLAARLAGEPGAEIYLLENGSRDGSWALAQALAARELGGVHVAAFREPAAGLGHALHRGLVEALAAHPGEGGERWLVLTAADLPFGFTDLDGATAAIAAGARIVVGSKAHRASEVGGGLKRRAGSIGYRALRRLVAGMRTADSQGSIFLRLDLAAVLVPRVASRDFFFSTELVFLAERLGERVVEVPVVLEPERRRSTVRLLRDAPAMFRQLAELTRREGRIR